MSILIVGSEGSMGKRYQAILRHLNTRFVCYDPSISSLSIPSKNMNISGVILATPTEMHLSQINTYSNFNVPILCEKPITKSEKDLEILEKLISSFEIKLTMMMQYELLDDAQCNGPSYYNYFRHGNDGLPWDCMQVIALAREKVVVYEDSPVWRCILNGKDLSLSDMDNAYVKFVRKWLTNPTCQVDKIIKYHEKVHQWLKSQR